MGLPKVVVCDMARDRRGTALSRKFRSQLDFLRVMIPGALREGGLEGLGEDINSS